MDGRAVLLLLRDTSNRPMHYWIVLHYWCTGQRRQLVTAAGQRAAGWLMGCITALQGAPHSAT